MATLTAKTFKGQTAGQIIEKFSEELNQAQLAWLAEQDEDKTITASQAANLLKMEDEDAEGSEENAFVFSTEHKPGIHIPAGTSLRVVEDPRAIYSWVGPKGQQTQKFLTLNSRGEQVYTFSVLLEDIDHGKFELILSQNELAYFLKKSFNQLEIEETTLTRATEKFVRGYEKRTVVVNGDGLYIIEDEKSNFSLNVERERLKDGGRMAMAIDHFESLSEEEKLEIGTDNHKEVFLHYQPRTKREDGTMPEVRGNVMNPSTSISFLPYGQKDLFIGLADIKTDSKLAKAKAATGSQNLIAKLQEIENLQKLGVLTPEEYAEKRAALIATL